MWFGNRTRVYHILGPVFIHQHKKKGREKRGRRRKSYSCLVAYDFKGLTTK